MTKHRFLAQMQKQTTQIVLDDSCQHMNANGEIIRRILENIATAGSIHPENAIDHVIVHFLANQALTLTFHNLIFLMA